MKSDQVSQGFNQLGLENFQGLRCHNLSGPLFHCSAVLMVKRFLFISFEPLLYQHTPIIWCFPTTHYSEDLGSPLTNSQIPTQLLTHSPSSEGQGEKKDENVHWLRQTEGYRLPVAVMGKADSAQGVLMLSSNGRRNYT